LLESGLHGLLHVTTIIVMLVRLARATTWAAMLTLVLELHIYWSPKQHTHASRNEITQGKRTSAPVAKGKTP